VLLCVPSIFYICSSFFSLLFLFQVLSSVFPACLECLMFWFSIKCSMVGPSVMAKHSRFVPSFGNGTSIEDIPPGQFIFQGNSNIICFVSFALLNICAACLASISGFIAMNAAFVQTVLEPRAERFGRI
jgi:hypothetical protein